jgi:hypothetical protein
MGTFLHKVFAPLMFFVGLAWLWFVVPHFNFYPPVGVYIAVLAFLAVIMNFWQPEGRYAKAAWVCIFAITLVLEIHTLYHARDEYDKQQTKNITEARESFNKILTDQRESFKGMLVEVRKGNEEEQKQFAGLLKGEKTLFERSLYTATGGQSFCIMKLGYPDSAHPEETMFSFHHRGKYPLYDVYAHVIDMRKYSEIVQQKNLDLGVSVDLRTGAPSLVALNVGNLPVESAKILSSGLLYKLADKNYFIIHFTARNGFWKQYLKLYNVKGVWLAANKVVTEYDKHIRVLFEQIDEGFPLNDKGEVDWNQL